MGIGASLAFIAVGAILAFATHFTVSGIDLRMIGWVLMGVGVVGLIITFVYLRPRRARVAEVVEDEPPYDAGPHVHSRRGYYPDDRLP